MAFGGAAGSVNTAGSTGLCGYQPFIFNWKGQFEKTCQKEEQLKKIFDKVIVINSDDTNEKLEWINVGDDYYFTDQFLKAVEVFDGDVMFHIQADASYDDFESLIEDAKKYYDVNHLITYLFYFQLMAYCVLRHFPIHNEYL